MATIGLDIGGANLKAATVDGAALSVPFDLWRAPEQLSQRLAHLLWELPPFDELAITMTGELADCFVNKRQGVDHIVRACLEVAQGRPLRIWSTAGDFVSPEQALAEPLRVAASNWHGLAKWAGRLMPEGNGLLVDVGSTTSDLIPLIDGRPATEGFTDVGRLQAGELVYTGVRRTPLCAVASAVPFRGRLCSLAAELFATTLDIYLLLGQIEEDANDVHTANGRPATQAAAADRIARMLCCDLSEVTQSELLEMARFLADAQRQQLMRALDEVVGRMTAPVRTVVVSGSGGFLAEEVLAAHPLFSACRMVRLEHYLSPGVAESACAYAVAVLSAEH